MKNSILLLLISLSVSAQTKYRVYLKTGTVEFSNLNKANSFALANKADSVVTVHYTVVNEDSIQQVKFNQYLGSIKQTAQSAVGIKYDALSITQIRALYAIDLFYKGAFDSTLKVRPLKDWVKH